MEYFAAFYRAKEKKGGFVVTFPDFPGCYTQGNTFREAVNAAQEALAGFLEVLRKDGDTIPEPSDFQGAYAKAIEESKEIGETSRPDVMMQIVG